MNIFKNNYSKARASTPGFIPDCVYFSGDPGACCIYDPLTNNSGYTTEEPFTYFFQHLLRVVFQVVRVTAQIPGLNAVFTYDLNNYFSTNMVKAEKI
jgi:hypothetical protein